LGEDIARKLGTLGYLTRLRRTWVEPFRELPMFTLEAALAGAEERSGLLPADAALGHLPRAGVGPVQAVALRHGQAVQTDLTGVPAGRRVRIYEPSGAFMGLAEVLPDGRLQPRRLISSGVP
jgi:tRNA pseudouridine55 synthase